jgi:hypothetical protein
MRLRGEQVRQLEEQVAQLTQAQVALQQALPLKAAEQVQQQQVRWLLGSSFALLAAAGVAA